MQGLLSCAPAVVLCRRRLCTRWFGLWFWFVGLKNSCGRSEPLVSVSTTSVLHIKSSPQEAGDWNHMPVGCLCHRLPPTPTPPPTLKNRVGRAFRADRTRSECKQGLMNCGCLYLWGLKTGLQMKSHFSRSFSSWLSRPRRAIEAVHIISSAVNKISKSSPSKHVSFIVSSASSLPGGWTLLTDIGGSQTLPGSGTWLWHSELLQLSTSSKSIRYWCGQDVREQRGAEW